MSILTRVLVCMGLAVTGLIFTWDRNGLATGTEWSPQRFEGRSFTYLQVAGFQATPKWTREARSDLEEYLHAKSLIPSFEPEAVTWDFVRGSAPGIRGWIGEARHLRRELRGNRDRGDDPNPWIEWSSAHPELAKFFWPEVARRARKHQYFALRVSLRHHGKDIREAKNVDEIQKLLQVGDAAGEN